MGLQANTATLFYRKVRMMIAKKLEAEALEFAGEIELDESYFGGVRKGKRGRGLATVTWAMLVLLSETQAAVSQTLDETFNRQLNFDPVSGNVCEELLGREMGELNESRKRERARPSARNLR